MLDQNFCDILEYKLCDIFENLNDEKLKGFWCDGILLSENDKHYSQKTLNKNRQVKMQALVGKDGQTVYSLTLKFGNKSLSRYAGNLDLVECIPQTFFKNWFKIDIAKKEIELQLD